MPVNLKRNSLVLLLVVSISSLAYAEKEVVDYLADFETPAGKSHWTGWAEGPQTISFSRADGMDGGGCVIFKTTSGGWNTGFITLPVPVPIKSNSMLRFYYKGVENLTLNISNSTEQVDYTLQASGPKEGLWHQAEIYLMDAVYKKGISENIVDGLDGDCISKIQFATCSQEWSLSNVEIVRVAKPASNPSLLGYPYTPRVMPQLDTVFPFGAVIALNRFQEYGEIFKGDPAIKMNEALIDIKRHHMNTFADFCPSFEVDYTLAEKYGLYVIETRFSCANVSQLSDQDKSKLKSYAKSTNLLAWYGADEPSDYKSYLKNKIEFDKMDPLHPYASAFTDLYAVKQLGPAMELVMLDAYDFRPGAEKKVNNFLYHANLIRLAKQYCAGGRVLFIAQTFSTPWNNGSWRYPCPEEIRFDVYNSISAGVNGFLFFLYNGDKSYLRKTSTGETIEFSLVDAWGNGNPTFDEISKLGAVLVPIMPSLTNSQIVKKADFDISFQPVKQLTHGIIKNEHGTFLIVVNKDLKSVLKGTIKISGLKEREIFNLNKLKQERVNENSKVNYELPPGGGNIFMIGSKDCCDQVKKDIIKRKYIMEKEIIDLDMSLLEKAGLNINPAITELKAVETLYNEGNVHDALSRIYNIRNILGNIQRSQNTYWSTKTKLEAIQREYGKINSYITKWPTRPSRTNKSWDIAMDQLAEQSSVYFKMDKRMKNGDPVLQDDLNDLFRKVVDLRKQIEQFQSPPR